MQPDLFKYTRVEGKKEYKVTLANSEDLIGTIKYDNYNDEWSFISDFWINKEGLKEILEVMEWLS